MKTIRVANAAKLVAVIDDDATVRRTTEALLGSRGFQVVAAEIVQRSNGPSQHDQAPR